MILCAESLQPLMPTMVGHTDVELLNPASIDIRVGTAIIFEKSGNFDPDNKLYNPPSWHGKQLKGSPYLLAPGELVFVATMEVIKVPLMYAMDLRLKSSRAREGYNHSLAFWVDPGWQGILTMEISNVSRYHLLPLYPGLRMAQVIVHKLDKPTKQGYKGRYQHAEGVEMSKDQPNEAP